jgi:hypothetical protein
MNQAKGNNNTSSQPARRYVRSLYLFPSYDLVLARQIAERVERDGAGTLSEETLAINLHLSVKSSGFQLKTLTARQFGLLTKRGQMLSTTPLAKAIFKPVNEAEKRNALVKSFLEIPLFREVANRFKGTPLPQSQDFRNILEREFKVDSKRVGDAERVLMDSAREAGVLLTSGGNAYLSTEPHAPEQSAAQTPAGAPPPITETPQVSVSGGKILPVIDETDLLELDDEQFRQFWDAYGEILRARAKRNQEQKESNKGKK